MDPRIHVITLAVNNLDRALEFYRDGLSLDTRGVLGGSIPDTFEIPTGISGRSSASSTAPRHQPDP
jgi:catechol 2,3-dioxygenase-like lactoylglutathione lyase family enzyme